MRVLTLNAGSNSLKFEVVDVPRPQREAHIWGDTVLSGAYDNIGKPNAQFTLLDGKRERRREAVAVATHAAAGVQLLEWIERGAAVPHSPAGAAPVSSLACVERIAHRVVHGADRFEAACRVTPSVIETIRALESLAPLHNRPARKLIEAVNAQVRERIPQYAVFDTSFHRAIPDEAALYAIPQDLASAHHVRRYGFHGISHRYLALRYAQQIKRSLHTLKLITLHLEGGSSVAAIRHGRSIDTSMGFTPLEGLVMGTRAGDLDPGLLLYLMREERWSVEQAELFLNHDCGLHGLSGISADSRELVRRIAEPAAEQALKVYSYRVRKYIGACLAALGGADAIIFGGGIGENTPSVRRLVAQPLGWCGAHLDAARNEDVIDREGIISTEDSPLPLWVIPTRENLMMAHEVAGIDGSA